ncbi:MAG TPA: hypothetical protein VKZ84_05955 [Bacteriovoracaceae bacterium]|nr:hypothetical protein [Bacteriovoracaceae bacterium]
MKINLLPLIFIFMTLGCLPDNYNFKENPVFILKEALSSLERRDSEQFLRISGREALCLYGNDTGLQRLSDSFPYVEEDLALEHKVILSQYNQPAKFVGYWSYKTERHFFSIYQKQGNKHIMDVLIDCEFGNEGNKLKEEDYKNEKKYKIKQCRLIKIIPSAFSSLSLPKKCEGLKVPYDH